VGERSPPSSLSRARSPKTPWSRWWWSTNRSVVIDPVKARTDEDLLFPDAGTNTSFSLDFGGDETLFDDCEVVVELTLANQRVAPCPLEVRSAAAHMSEDGRLEFNSSTQAPHGVRDALATFLDLNRTRCTS